MLTRAEATEQVLAAKQEKGLRACEIIQLPVSRMSFRCILRV